MNDDPIAPEDVEAQEHEATPQSLDEATYETILARIARETGRPGAAVRRTVELLREGATIPFIARYRKEATGGLDEVVIAAIEDRLEALTTLEQRRAYVLKTIETQGKLTAELKARIEAAPELRELEDLYLPYKPRRRTRAQKAREAGLEPLADMLLAGDDGEVEARVDGFLNDAVPDRETAFALARDIIAERVSEDADVREKLREIQHQRGTLSAVRGKTADPEGKYAMLFEYEPDVKTIPGHRVLAFNRARNEGVLKTSIRVDEVPVKAFIRERYIKRRGTRSAEQVEAAIDDGYGRLLFPGIEAETYRDLKERADDDAIEVFIRNLREVLMAPPLGAHAVVGIDPGFRTGCKVALVDPHGDYVAHTTIYPHPPQNETAKAAETLLKLIASHERRFPIPYIAYGNGTASRETGRFLGALASQEKARGRTLECVEVNESGASIYSASAMAREEFPDLDVTVRGAISIARRLKDPLAELIKIDPKSIGVGQYQHDVDQKKLALALERTVAWCVNQVGVELNTASWALLAHVSGLSVRLAKAIVKHRAKINGFADRRELLDVPGLGEKTFELAAGFLRIRGGANILDNTAVHPERYALVGDICTKAGLSLVELVRKPEVLKRLDPQSFIDPASGVGLPTVKDIFEELGKPGRDPRGVFEPVQYAEGIEAIDDLRTGMILPGVVTNVTKFGAFVDVGVHQDGLVHISELADRFVKDPADVVSVGQKVRVKVLTVEPDRKRIGLSIKQVPR